MSRSTAFKKTSSAVESLLLRYDIITFDVFDTLITRCVLRPEDVFSVVETTAKNNGLIRKKDFAYERRQAEKAAYEKYGETADFTQIYALLGEKFSYTDAQCKELMELEFNTELRMVIPRVAVRELLFKLKAAGKRIMLCSDMYLSSDAIRKLLAQCGYSEDLELWVSNEKGATKASGGMWRQLFDYLPSDQRIIHVGDNEDADYRSLKQMGKDALLIDSGLTLFKKSELYDYLSQYEMSGIGNSLVLGYLANKACFNSPFDGTEEKDIVSIWGGPAFACFMDFMATKRDDSQLLFVTREGYLLKPMYERYCKALDVEPQCNTLFYSSRAATIAATVTSEKDVWEAMQRPAYQGTIGHFVKSRMNFDLSAEEELYDTCIVLPEQRKMAFNLLKPYFLQIFENGRAQKKAYQKYVSEIRMEGKALTVVDVGYNGTIQYALAKLLSEQVSGMYMFLNYGALPQKIGCNCKAIATPRSGIHPLYDNLLFLEAVMQVPYGQVQRMTIEENKAKPICNTDANFSEYIPIAQEQLCQFVEWIGGWKKEIGSSLKLDFDLAEAIWVCLPKFRYLPKNLLESFWLADDYCGHPMWKYDYEKQEWQGSYATTPLAFSLVKSGTKISLKHKIKGVIKRYIPNFAYEWAGRIWVKYIK